MRFRQWLENEDLEAKASAMPASAEVIRTGLQPQINSQEIETKQKNHFDRSQAVDAHLERIRHAMKGEKGELKKVCNRILELWDEYKNKPYSNPQNGIGLQNIPAGITTPQIG